MVVKRETIVHQIAFHQMKIDELSNLSTNCLSCSHYAPLLGTCSQHGLIPEQFRIICTCPDWEHDLIPF